MEILAFQTLIVFSLIVAKFISQKSLELVAAGWAIFTLIMVFASPLILLQLIVIWLTYSALNSKGDRPLVRGVQGCAQGQMRLTYPSTKATDRYTDQIVLDAKIKNHTEELEGVIETEMNVLNYAVRHAERVFERKRRFAEAGEDYQRAYEKHRERFEALFEPAANEPDQVRIELPAPPDFQTSLKHPEPKVAAALDAKYAALKHERHERITALLARMAEDQTMEDAFWEKVGETSKKRLTESLDDT